MTQTEAARPSLALASAAAPVRLKIAPIAAAEGEDGGGGRAPATDQRALDVHADAWPGRALDPVLHIGDLHFHDYRFLNKKVMRFVIADVARLRAGDPVWVQWGDDTSSRIDISPSLEVPR